MPDWSTRIAAIGLAVLSSVSMTGCAADRTADANRLRPEIQAITGVTSADVRYVNDFENGANLDIELDMSDASIDDIRAAAEKINDLEGSRFDDHRLSTKIAVADRGGVEYGGYGVTLDADLIAADTGAVRELGERVTADTIQWVHFEDFSSLELRDSTDPDSDLRAAVAVLPGRPTQVSVRSVAPEQNSSWEVALPLTLQQVNDVVALRDRLPVTVYHVDVHDGRVGGLDVNLGDPASADGRMQAVLAAVAPSHEHPIAIEWRLATRAPGEIGRFTACSTVGSESPTARPPTFDSLRDHFQQEFAGCVG